MAVSGRSRGATAAGHGLDADWMGDDWMAFTRSTRNYGPGDSDSRQADGERDWEAEPGRASRVRLEPGPGKESTTPGT